MQGVPLNIRQSTETAITGTTDPITVHAWVAMTGDATTAMMPKQQSSARSMQDDGCI